MKIPNKQAIYGLVFLAASMVGCEYWHRSKVQDIALPASIRPESVQPERSFNEAVTYEGIIYKTIDRNNKCEIFFIDHGIDGSLDQIVVANATGRDTITTTSENFAKWNQVFTDYRQKRYNQQ